MFAAIHAYGTSCVILFDNGKEFNNILDIHLADVLGIKRRLTTPYHPQVNQLNCCFY